MFKNRKIDGKLGVGKSEKRKLRMLRPDQAFQPSLISVAETGLENVCEGSQKDIRTSMLEAEYKKAEALVTFQNNRRFY